MVDTADLRLYDLRCREIIKQFDYPMDRGIACRDYNNFKDILSMESFNAVLRAKRSRKAKRSRARKKLTRTLSREVLETNKLVFTTCTLDDKHLYLRNGSLKRMQTLNKNIDKWIHEHFDYAIVNVDYGEKNERLHYHLIGYLKADEGLSPVLNKKGEQSRSKKGFPNWVLRSKTYKLGFEPTVNVVEDVLSDSKKLTNYLLKINSHSNKPSTRNHRLRVIGRKEVLDSINNEVYHEYLRSISYKLKD